MVSRGNFPHPLALGHETPKLARKRTVGGQRRKGVASLTRCPWETTSAFPTPADAEKQARSTLRVEPGKNWLRCKGFAAQPIVTWLPRLSSARNGSARQITKRSQLKTMSRRYVWHCPPACVVSGCFCPTT